MEKPEVLRTAQDLYDAPSEIDWLEVGGYSTIRTSEEEVDMGL